MKLQYLLLYLYFVLSCLFQVNSFSNKNYPYNPKIHTLGNVGFGGKIHARIAPYVTRLIDYNAYNGVNIRREIYKDLIKDYENHANILDLCCGVCISTPKHEKCIGIDTSKEMIEQANRSNKKNKNNFLIGNAENVYDTIDFKEHFLKNGLSDFNGFDITTIFFAFHEIPQNARQDIISYHIKNTKNLIIIDIDPVYKPSKMMYSGEPYLFDYKENIRQDLKMAQENVIVNKHVIMWTIDCKER